MNKEIKHIIRYWVEKSEESLESAEDELKEGRLSFSVNRIYYSCFYIVSALLLQKGYRFKKHSGVRACFHQHFVKSGAVSEDDGKFYDRLFSARLKGDYVEFTDFEKSQVEEWLRKAKEFVEKLKGLIEEFQEK